ncbi:MAG: glycosyltransferase family 2 protein [Hyphomicrobiaceae bacterium]
MTQRKIVGVCLVKNEEHFVGWALSNAADFCDEILVMDNRSQDRTRSILEALAGKHGHIRILDVDDANKTHAHVEHLAGTDTWVFGIDGDEIYDRDGLARLRPRILSGEFDDYWRVFGHTIHTRTFRQAQQTASGYIPPDARSISKLYNFAGISSWRQPHHERLHGKDMVFRPGYAWDHAYNFWQHGPWSSSDCRCLHFCFTPRSAHDPGGDPRNNPVDVKKAGRPLRRLTTRLLRLVDADYDVKKNYKYRFYAQGEIVTEPLSGFGRPMDFLDITPHAGEVEAMLADSVWLPEAIR